MHKSKFSFATPPRLAAMVTWGITALACGASAPALRAELTWKQKTVELGADARASTLEARFPFTNDGKTAVDIQQIQTSCGCTTAELKQRHYEPGEGGEIVAIYTIGDHVGLQSKTVIVSSNDETETTLTLTAHLPELLRVQPAIVAWKPGEAITTKTILLGASPENLTFDDVSMQASNASMTAVLRPVVGGNKYEIQVTPLTTDRPTFVTFLIRTRLGKRENLFRAYATVEMPPLPRGPVPLTSPANQPLPATASVPSPAG